MGPGPARTLASSTLQLSALHHCRRVDDGRLSWTLIYESSQTHCDPLTPDTPPTCGVVQVVACEWNPRAVEALRRNLALNGVEGRAEVRQGDCCQVAPRGVAHRVLLGLLPSSQGGWSTALAALRPEGQYSIPHTGAARGVPVQRCTCFGPNLLKCGPFVVLAVATHWA